MIILYLRALASLLVLFISSLIIMYIYHNVSLPSGHDGIYLLPLENNTKARFQVLYDAGLDVEGQHKEVHGAAEAVVEPLRPEDPSSVDRKALEFRPEIPKITPKCSKASILWPDSTGFHHVYLPRDRLRRSRWSPRHTTRLPSTDSCECVG